MIPQEKSALKTLRPKRPEPRPVRCSEKRGSECQSW